MSDAGFKADPVEILEPLVRILTPLFDDPDGYCVISSIVPLNVVAAA
jgi:hypothetical protein